MKKFILLCTMLATLVCLAYAEYQVNQPGYEAAKDRYYQLMDKVVTGRATQQEAAELNDLCQVYGFDLPVVEPAETESRGGENLDSGSGDCTSPTVIPGCPYTDAGYFDGDDDCSQISAAPYNEVFYQFTPPFTGRYQMRVRSYSGTVPAIRILRTACCTGGINVAFAYGSVGTDCPNPFGGMEPSTVITYLYWLLSADSTYYIHVGTYSGTVYTSAYDFNLWCFGCPPDESPSHQTCATAQTIACSDSVFGDSAYYGTPASNDWYKIVIPDVSPMAESLYVFVGGREMGHCISGRYPSGTPLIDGRFTLYKERTGETCVYDSIGYSDDDGCSYDAVRTVAVDSGTYYIRVWNYNVYEYVLLTKCIQYNPIAACCFLNASCYDYSASACAVAGGWSKPIGVLCSSNPCPVGPCPHESKDLEPNNTCGPTVQEVFCDSSYCGVITPATDMDWYKLVIADCESLVVDVFGDSTSTQWPYHQKLNPHVSLYKADCVTQLVFNDNNNGTAPDPVGIDSRLKKVVGAGTYYIKVQSSYLTSGPYVMHITCIPRECLPGDNCGSAITITDLPFVDTLKTTCGYVDDYRLTCMGSYTNGPDVIYAIELDGHTCFACSLFAIGNTGGSPYGSVSLYANCPTSASQPCIAKSVGASVGPYGFTCQGIGGALPAGTYYIMVDNYAPGPDCINYTLRVFPCECPTPCPYPSLDNEAINNTCGTGVPVIASGDTLCGADSITADADWYQFTLTECDSVKIDVWADDTPGQWAYGNGLNPYAYLYKSDCTTLIASNDNVGGTPYNYDSRLVSGCVLQAGTYYIKVTATASTYGPYILILTGYPAACPDLTGDVCATPRVIPSLPYTDAATTCCDYANDYNPTTCLGASYGTGPDVIYQLTLDGSTCFSCTLFATGSTGGSPYGSISLWDACPTPSGTCLAKAYASTGPYVINCQGPLGALPAGNYYIMIDNYPAPPCINYTLKVVPCACPPPCETYTLCGTPGEVEPNNTCPPPVGQAEISCDMSVYGLHCPDTDTDFWKVTVPPMTIMTIRVYTGPTCSANPPVGLYARYYNDLCASPTTGSTAAIVITNSTASPLVKYLEVYDNGSETQTLYQVMATCSAIRNYCTDPIVTGPSPDNGCFWTLDSTVNTCAATNVIDTVWSHGCGAGTKYASGPDVIFKIILGTSGTMRISANSVGSGDGQFYVFTDCANPKTTCIASEDYYSGTTVERDTVAVAADTYYVAVSHFGSTACGDMHLQIDCDLPAWATGHNWNNAAGGSWFTPSNWTPSGVPGWSDTARIVLSGTYIASVDSQSGIARQLFLGGGSGTQTLRIVAPASQLVLTDSGDIGAHGRLNVGQERLFIGGAQSSATLANSGTISLDSSGTIDLDWNCSLRNWSGGSILFNGMSSVTANYEESWQGYVVNEGSIIKSGTDTLSLFCAYTQSSGGTLALESGSMHVWTFTTNGLVTLSSGTTTILGGGEVTPPELRIDTLGVVELQGTASISGDGLLMNYGELRHTLAGTSVISAYYRPLYSIPPNDGDIRVLAGKLSLTSTDNWIDGLVVISPSTELEVFDGSFSSLCSLTSAVADSGTLTLAGDHVTNVQCPFSFSGNLQIRGASVAFDPTTDPVSIHSFTIESGAHFTSSVTIQTDSVSMNGGTTNADVVVNDHYGWTAGEFVGSGGSTINIDTGTTLDVHGPTTKQLNTRDMVISGTANMSGSGQFSMSGGASIVVDPAGSLTIGDSISITGTGDSVINHGQLTFNCPNDTATVSAFLLNQPTVRTPGTIDILSGQVTFGAGENDGTVNVFSGSQLNLTEELSNGAMMEFKDGSRCKVSGTLGNGSGGTIHICGGAEIEGTGTIDNAGLVGRVASAQRTPTHSIVAAVFHNLQGTGCLEINSDTLTLAGGGSNAGDIFIHERAVLRLLGTFVNEPSGTIRGGGTLDISGATFSNNGGIAPGASPGTLSIVGALSTRGKILIEDSLPSQYDHLLIGGNADLGGTLQFSLLGGFRPTLTDTFHCITYASRTGVFAAVTGTPVGNGTFMEIDYRPTEIVQYVCSGVSDIQISRASILDTVICGTTDTETLQVCNAGHCPLVWTSAYVQHSPANPTWLTIIEGNEGLLERTLCDTMKLAINTAGLSPNTYSGDVVLHSNDPTTDSVMVIPVQLVVPNDRVNNLVIRVDRATNSVILNWSAVFGANSYKVYRSNSGSFNPTVLLGSTANTTFTHTGTLGVTGATRLVYHVVASTDAPP